MRSHLLHLSLTIALAATLAAREGGDAWPYLARVRDVVTEPEQRGALRTLASLGPSAAPTLWAIRSGQALAEEDFDRGACFALLEKSIASWPAKDVVTALVAAPDADTPLTARLVLLELLSWTRSDAGLEAVFTSLEVVEPALLATSRVSKAVVAALVPLLEDDPRRFRLLEERLADLPEKLLPTVVRAVGATSRPEGLAVLASSVSFGGPLEMLVLGELSRYEFQFAPDSTNRCTVFVRRYLRSLDARQRRLAAAAVGRLRDTESFWELTTLLGDEDPVVRRVAGQSLQELSGLRRAWNGEQWAAWFETEQAWLDDADHFGRDIRSGDSYRVNQAVRELSSHRIFADETAQILARGLDSRSSQVRVRTCEGLARLKHATALHPLIEALDDTDENVRTAAHAALLEVVAFDLGPDVEPWRAWSFSL